MKQLNTTSERHLHVKTQKRDRKAVELSSTSAGTTWQLIKHERAQSPGAQPNEKKKKIAKVETFRELFRFHTWQSESFHEVFWGFQRKLCGICLEWCHWSRHHLSQLNQNPAGPELRGGEQNRTPYLASHLLFRLVTRVYIRTNRWPKDHQLSCIVGNAGVVFVTVHWHVGGAAHGNSLTCYPKLDVADISCFQQVQLSFGWFTSSCFQPEYLSEVVGFTNPPPVHRWFLSADLPLAGW